MRPCLPSPVMPDWLTIKGSSLKSVLKLNHLGVLQVTDADPKRRGVERLVGKEVEVLRLPVPQAQRQSSPSIEYKISGSSV